MGDLLHVIAAVILWTVVAWRAGMVREGSTQRSLWLALTMLACGQTLQIASVYLTVESVIAVPGSAMVARHTFVLFASAGVRTLLNGLVGDRPVRSGPHVTGAAVALVVMIGPFVVAPPGAVPPALADRAVYYDPTWRSVVHWAGYVGYLGWALYGATRLCWRYGWHSAPGPLRTGLVLLGSGAAIGLGYVVLKVAVVLAWVAGVGPRLVALDAVAEAVILSVSIVLIAIGSAYEALSRGFRRTMTTIRDRRSMWRLYPLWRALYDVAPQIALAPERTRWAGLLLSESDCRLHLVRRVVEIRDGLVTIAPHIDGVARQAARAAATRAGLHGHEADAVAEAAGLELALRAKARGDAPTGEPVPGGVGGQDLQGEVRWLVRLGAARRSPIMRQAVAAAENGRPP